MTSQIYENYIITKKLNLDLTKLKNSCWHLYSIVKSQFNDNKDFSAGTQLGASLYSKYNLLLYPFDEFHELYTAIQQSFEEFRDPSQHYYVSCWLNIYREGEFIDWHNHGPASYNAWHGFVCVDTESSFTSYRVPGIEIPVDVKSEDNLLVLSKTAGDVHRTWPWTNPDKPRITIAFDIMPRYSMDKLLLNHWIPL